MTLFCLVSSMLGQIKISLKNNLKLARTNEVVEVYMSQKYITVLSKPFILLDDKDMQIPYQLVFNDKKELSSFVFQADVAAKSSKIYYVKSGTPILANTKTSARFVPERKDDFAWENELAAYRMYGPALAAEKPSNGVDLWLKSTSDTVVNKRYRQELHEGLSYHIDRGEGLDCYAVGHTLGAGGITPFLDGKVLIGDHYDRYKVIENGPLRSVFTLYSDAVKIDKEIFKREITITTTAGGLLNKAEVTYRGANKQFQLAAGISLHEVLGKTYDNIHKGIIAYAEDAVSIHHVPAGRNYVAVIMSKNIYEKRQQENHLLLVANYRVGSTYTYYFGGGWSKGGFAADVDWFKAVRNYHLKVKYPIKVKVI
ncbi:MAG: hypothetical protein AUK44_08470 [Porphyromonadaceae bacterium CG2_30_38_12]|nr:MAG: hypothetical protein AUK44_08470 [Porphyromonadaceae bacterium CG2_30_38_12]